MANVLEVKDKVQRYLSSAFKGVTVDSDGDYSFRIDSARVFVGVREWAEEHVVVNVFAIVLSGLSVTQELKDYVALEANDYIFGTVQLAVRDDGEANLIFRHNILGDYLDEDELMTACKVVAVYAETEDDILQGRFGGKRFHED